MLAIDVALASEPPVDGVAVLAGRLLSASLPALRGKAAGKITVFMAHGRADEVVPFAAGQQLKALLEQHGHAVTWRAFAGGHRLPSPKLLHELIAFIG